MIAIGRKLASLSGPAAVIAAGSMGAGSVATLILAGAWFRYDLLWVVLLTLPLFVAAVDSSSRIGSVNQAQGMLSIVRRHIHPGVAWMLLLVNVPVHILVGMSQLSVMTTALLTLGGMDPETIGAADLDPWRGPAAFEAGLSFALAGLVVWLVLSRGYRRMQRVMTMLMVSMFVCFLLIALKSLSEIGDILRGFVPTIPQDLPVPARGTARLSTSSIIAIVGSTLAPGSLLAIPYLSSDAARVRGRLTLREDLHKFMINLGVIFGAYSMFILIAGGFALYPLANHAGIETVHDAGQVLTKALPRSLGFVGPVIFTLGLFIAAMTTLVVCVQVVIYLSLDMLNKPWKFSGENRLYRRLVILVTVAIGVLAPVWDFPALLKVILMMGVNVFVVPLVVAAMIYLLNSPAVMGRHIAGRSRNLLLALCLLVACGLAATQLPGYLAVFL